MLQIRLNKPSSESTAGAGAGVGGAAAVGGVVKPLPVETVTVACPDHLVLADLPVAKAIGAVTAATLVKSVGRRSRRHLGERVHFCVRCDFPIAIYGRLGPCEHAFCLDCARSDSMCYLCDERIQKIQTIKMMEGIFICAAPHCLKSFLKRSEFESHIHESHANLLRPNAEKEDGNESEVQSAKQPTPSDSTVRGPPRSNAELLDSEDKTRRQQHREQSLPRPMMQPKPSFFGQVQNYQSEPQPDSSHPPGFDRPILQSHFPQGSQHDSGQVSDKQQGIMPENQPMHSIQPPNFVMHPNMMMTPQFGMPPFQPDGPQPFYGAPYDMAQMARPDSAQGAPSEHGSLLGFPPGMVGGVNFMPNYPQQPWNSGPPPAGAQGMGDAFSNPSDSQGNVAFYQANYGQNPGVMPMMPPTPLASNKGMEAVQGSNGMDHRDGKGILAAQPYMHPPQPPMGHSSQPNRGKYYSGDMSQDGQGFWQQEGRDGQD